MPSERQLLDLDLRKNACSGIATEVVVVVVVSGEARREHLGVLACMRLIGELELRKGINGRKHRKHTTS